MERVFSRTRADGVSDDVARYPSEAGFLQELGEDGDVIISGGTVIELSQRVADGVH
jgi:hypothetical protein